MSWLWLLWACSCGQKPVEPSPSPAPVVAPAPAPAKGGAPASAEVRISGDLNLQTADLSVKCSPERGYVTGGGWTITAEGIDGPVQVSKDGRTFRDEFAAKRWPSGWKFNAELHEVEGEGTIQASVTIDCGFRPTKGAPAKGTPKK